MMDKIYISPRMKEIRLNSEPQILRQSTDDVFTRKHDAMFDDVEEEE